MRVRILLPGAVLAGVALFAGCDRPPAEPAPAPPSGAGAERTTATGASTDPPVFDRDRMEADVERILREVYTVGEVGEVSCPADQIADETREFDCAATVDGQQRQVPIRVRGGNGEYEVGRPAEPG
ncbi:hypothetical protein CFN78_11875 [Amycolatopsis antarctica]|uniref:DUF4333 domain-containing protein n=1 Tax=Amycolatopsis antarctica TaxID=1854586 RepID=A0A263D5S7_9PSEU|nr:DUF4333 domain-containing protein [Amycolatopsis antarctica]OZM72947.1 hypothetical protein CFN78_11875 [Amycolatopsis antarctica]